MFSIYSREVKMNTYTETSDHLYGFVVLGPHHLQLETNIATS